MLLTLFEFVWLLYYDFNCDLLICVVCGLVVTEFVCLVCLCCLF